MNHALTWPDLFNGRAELAIPPESIIALAEKAGAPWNDFDPDAKLSPLQREIITAPERTIVVFGGSRGGKSISAACIVLAELMKPNAQIALVGANYEHCSKEFGYVWRGFFNLFPRSAATEAQFVTRSPHFSMRLQTVWGSRIQVYSVTAKEGGQLLGNEFDVAVLCEAAQVPSDVFNNKLERALLGRAKQRRDGYLRNTGRAILLTTPKGQGGCSYDLYSRALQRTKGRLDNLLLKNGAEWSDSLYFKQCDVRELNPSYPKQQFEAARRNLPRRDFEEQFLGMAILRSGLVYSSFKEDRTVIPKEQLPAQDVLRRSRFGIGIDTGNNFAAVLAALTPEGKAYIIGETFEVGQNTEDNAKAILQMVDAALGDLFPNPKAAVSLWVVDINSQNILDLEDHLDVNLFYQKYDVLDSIGHLDMRMGQGQISIVEDCDFLLNEIRSYRYKKAKEGRTGPRKDTPMGEDHLLDAMRYLLMQLFELGPQPADAVIWSVDQMLEKERNDLLTPNMERDLQNRARSQWGSFLEASW